MAKKVALVIPCYRVSGQILQVLAACPSEIDQIYIIDDKCPEKTGQLVISRINDKRVRTIFNEKNLGVGGAVKVGYSQALADGAQIVVKCDGDGQMDPKEIPALIAPILAGRADYVKGNRFYFIDSLKSMPTIRLIGNSCLSLLNKISSGYWHVMDPSNGFTAIHSDALKLLPVDKIAEDYFFEHDMLFRLNTVRANVEDVPMQTFYGDESSSLKIGKVIRSFIPRLLHNFIKRISYNYFIRDFNIGTVYLIGSMVLMGFGFSYGLSNHLKFAAQSLPTPTGIIMTTLLAMILGFQLLLSFISVDITPPTTPPIQQRGISAIRAPNKS